jgi:antibiotic biosynthesis monooxygenase (ABM) superfamily enzyme
MNEASAVAVKPAAVVIKMRLRAGVEQGFSAWHAKICTVAAQLPGFISAEVNAQAALGPLVSRTVHHFRSDDQLGTRIPALV